MHHAKGRHGAALSDYRAAKKLLPPLSDVDALIADVEGAATEKGDAAQAELLQEEQGEKLRHISKQEKQAAKNQKKKLKERQRKQQLKSPQDPSGELEDFDSDASDDGSLEAHPKSSSGGQARRHGPQQPVEALAQPAPAAGKGVCADGTPRSAHDGSDAWEIVPKKECTKNDPSNAWVSDSHSGGAWSPDSHSGGGAAPVRSAAKAETGPYTRMAGRRTKEGPILRRKIFVGGIGELL